MKIVTTKIMICGFVVASFLAVFPVHAKMYKWKDDNGQTHYGDSIPAQYLNKERKELNDQGTVIKNIGRAATAEELKAKKDLEDIEKEKEVVLVEQRRQDRILLDTYTTERDLVMAREARIDAVNSQINLSKSIIESTKDKLEKTEKRISNIKAGDREVPADVYTKLDREKEQLETQTKVADGHIQKREAIKKQFDYYIKRFNELKLGQQSR